MPRKKRIAILCSCIALVLLISIIIIYILYTKTDTFKSSRTLLVKYMMQNADNINNISNNFKNDILDERKYTSKTDIKLNYTKNAGTSSENTKNAINEYTLTLEGKVDKQAKYNFQDIKILDGKNNEKMKFEYVRDNNTYGIKFSDLFYQYILVDNYNLKDIYQDLNTNDEQSINFPDSIKNLEELNDIIKFSDEEKNVLRDKYTKILEAQFQIGKVTKKKNEMITINEQELKTTAFTLTLTKEEINNIYLKFLEELKQDDIILSKLDNINETLSSYNLILNSNEKLNLKEDFVKNIEKTIQKINKTNIGQEETQIIVYTNNKQTVRTKIKYLEYEIYLDFLQNNYVQFKIQKLDAVETKTYTLNCNENSIEFNFNKNIDGTIKDFNILKTTHVNEENIKNNFVMKYEYGTNRIETNIEQNINLTDELKDLPKINNNNAIKINDLDKEATIELVNRIKSSLNQKIDTTFVNKEREDFNSILKALGLKRDIQEIQPIGVTDAERNRYNSQFDILQGENLKGKDIITAINAIKGNINKIDIISNTELKIKLIKFKSNSNEGVVKQLVEFLEKNSDKIYDIKIDYDENGLANYIVLNIVPEKK